MLFKSATAASVLGFCSLSSSAFLPHKRSTESGTSLYVYGTDPSGDGPNGRPIFYADGKAHLHFHAWTPLIFGKGLAYVGSTTPSWATAATNITFTLDPDSTTTAWTISPNSTTVSFNSTKSMYIVPTTGDFTQVGFSSSNDTLPTYAVTTGFTFFGTNVAYVFSLGTNIPWITFLKVTADPDIIRYAANGSNYELLFWAAATNTSGLYALYWNAAASNGNMVNGSFPVTVKTTPPVVLTAWDPRE